MNVPRPYISSSISLSAPSTYPERPPKRRLSSLTDFSASFPTVTIPEPTTLPIDPYAAARPPLPTRNQTGTNALTMDPSSEDPTAIFLHPPFADFSNAHQYPDGLTYTVLADNPEWFLDPRDYNAPTNDNPNAIPYPSQLEPPRGWCPAKKKDLKQLGADGWPEGEEPRLRCTFCRRTYAGVNAKSMWRRHVYEKHKIAMANRRDGTERVRGRNSNKENKKGSALLAAPTQSWETVDSVPTAHEASSSKSNARASGSMQPPPSVPGGQDDSEYTLATPTEDQESIFVADGPKPTQPTRKFNTPPLTPQTSRIARGEPVLALPTPSDILNPASSTPYHRAVPESPYNPLATPAFRHSPPRLPSDQPWRFPSPTHPLHSSATELTLCSVVRGDSSPFTPAGGLQISPVIIGPHMRKTPGGSPSLSFFGVRPRSRADLGVFAGEHQERSPFRGLFSGKATPRRLFSASSLRSLAHSRGASSDLSGDLSGDSLCFSDINDSWDSSGTGSLLDPPIDLGGGDPFSLLGLDGSHLSPPESSPEMDSPVIRKSYTLDPNTRAPASSLRFNFVSALTASKDETAGDVDDDDELVYPDDEPSPATIEEKLGAPARGDVKSPVWDEEFRESPPSRPAKRRKLTA